MDRENLIQDIVNELMNRLRNTSKRVCVIGDIPEDTYTNKEIEFVSCSSYCVDEDIVLITTMSATMLANLANGMARTRQEEIILDCLLNGKKVYILEDAYEYQRYKRIAYKALYHLYQDYEMKFNNYGIQVIRNPLEIFDDKANYSKIQYQQFADQSYKRGYDVTNTPIGKVDWRKKHLLLEKDFMNSRIESNRIVLITKDCIITPMARDYIREHQIHIERG
jgi:ethanolamine utilization protein